MTVYYSSINTSTYISEPQLRRWRSRFRGQKESYKINLEISQIAYDLRKISEAQINLENEFAQDAYNIEYGTTLYNTTIDSEVDIITRIQALQQQVAYLESIS